MSGTVRRIDGVVITSIATLPKHRANELKSEVYASPLSISKTMINKILFVNTLADAERGGGAEFIIWQQIRGLTARGYKCVLLSTRQGSGLSVKRDGRVTTWLAGIRNIYWPAKTKRPSIPLRTAWHALDSYNPFMQAFIRRVVAEEKPDVASLHNLAGWSAATLDALAELEVPSVQILHDYYLICAKSTMRRRGFNCSGGCSTCRLFRLPHRRLTQNVSAVVGVSRFVLDRHVGMGYFSNVPIRRVIYNACEPKHLGAGMQSNYPSHAALRFGYIGSLSPAKGIASFLAAFRSADMGDSTLWIAGRGKQAYEQWLRKEFSDVRIVFRGRMRPKDFYSQVDVVVVPSLWNDNFPSVIFEAFAFGKPVLASRRGGISEMVRDHHDGLLFDPENEGELIECLRKLQADSELRRRLTTNAALSASRYTDFSGWIDQYERLYREVADRRYLST